MALTTKIGRIEIMAICDFIPAPDYEWWTSEGVIEGAAHIPTQAQPLEELGLLQLTNDGDGIVPGVRALATPGHTPGHQSFLIESDGEKGVVTGDVIHSRAQITEPDWCRVRHGQADGNRLPQIGDRTDSN